jgi:hypothetical protein
MQLPLDIGQRDVDDRDVQQQHEHPERHRDQRPPFRLHQLLLTQKSVSKDQTQYAV